MLIIQRPTIEALGDEVRRNVHAVTVHSDVTVTNKLSRIGTRIGETGAVGNVVEATLEHRKQV